MSHSENILFETDLKGFKITFFEVLRNQMFEPMHNNYYTVNTKIFTVVTSHSFIITLIIEKYVYLDTVNFI